MSRAIDPAITAAPDPPIGTGGTVTWLPGAASPRAGAGDRAELSADGAGLIRETVAARAALREAAAAATAAAARALFLADQLDAALAHLADVETPAQSPAQPPARAASGQVGSAWLSRREREVLALVVEGRTNKEIAGALFLSPNTVKTHITSLLHKLRVDSRVRLAAIAMEQGLHQATGGGSR